ncbi:MAG TPA: hypothetical protein VMC43_02170 [Candidatus Paceibacterota bacterium]|nr:hypothetical protein [Candidatus Paceibacterota bacterium]
MTGSPKQPESENSMKSFVGALSILALCAGCEMPQPVVWSFAQAIKSPAAAIQASGWHPMTLNEGVVVYVAKKQEAHAVVVMGLPLEQIDPNKLSNDEVMVVRFPSQTALPSVGAVLAATGGIHEAEHNDRKMYFFNATEVSVTRQIALQDPDFAALVKAAEKRVANDNSFDDMMLILVVNQLILFNNMNN